MTIELTNSNQPAWGLFHSYWLVVLALGRYELRVWRQAGS